MSINDRGERRLLVELELGRSGGRRPLPFFGDGAFVELADEFGGIEVLGQERRRVYGGVGGCCVAAGVSPDYCESQPQFEWCE